MSRSRRTSAHVIIRNTGHRLPQDRWASLITIVGQVVAAGVHEGTTTSGPYTSQPTAEQQAANWLVNLLPDRVVNLQQRLANVAKAYPTIEIIWAETILRRIRHGADPADIDTATA